MTANAKPTLGVFGLTGCAGDQLALLNCEDELMSIVELVEVKDFLMASSANDEDCHLDVALVEGAVASRRDEERLLRIRERSGLLVAFGTCAVWGGVAAMDRFGDRSALLATVYGEAGKAYDQTPVRALHEVVPVDLAIPGCPVEREELLSAVASLLHGDPPLLPQYPVCNECKMRENGCLLARPNVVCLGLLTAAGCDARCPSYGIPCVGCRGPARDANVPATLNIYEERGIDRGEVARKLRTFAPAAPQH